MVVEPGNTPITLATVLRASKDMRFTNLTVVVVARRVESYIISLAVQLQLYCLISRVLDRGPVAIIGGGNAE